MRSPIPIFYNDNVYQNIEIIKPSGAVIADTKKEADKGDFFSSIKVFIAGCTASIDDVADKVMIKKLVSQMPYRSAEAIAIKIMADFYADDDGIEGVYPCPRCGHKIISEYRENEGTIIDTRDFISNLHIGYYDDVVNEIKVELSEPVILKNKIDDRVLEEIEEFSIKFPTLENGINACARMGLNDTVRLQYAIYADALLTVNGQVAEKRWKDMFGLPLFENIKDAKKDIGQINEVLKRYGINPEVEKRCPKCEKVWRPEVNTTNFFASGLQ